MPPKSSKPKGGKGGRKGKKGNAGAGNRELLLKEESQEYGVIVKLLGSSNMEVDCFDGKKRMGHVRGSMQKRVWIALGDVVLVGLRDFEDSKCDVIGKYSLDEVRQLKKRGELPESFEPSVKSGQSKTGEMDLPDDYVVHFDQQAKQLELPSDSDSDNEMPLPELDDL